MFDPTLRVMLSLALTVALDQLRVLLAVLFLVVGMFRPTTASGCRGQPGNTPGLSPASFGDNGCGTDVGTPADRTPFAEDDKRRRETNFGSKDNGGTGSSRLLRIME